jgi:hypothetical protein
MSAAMSRVEANFMGLVLPGRPRETAASKGLVAQAC